MNKVAIRNNYPLPWADDLIDCLEGAKYFSNVHLKTDYFHIGIAENDIRKTTFRMCYGYYKFLIMPFGSRLMPRPHSNKKWMIYLKINSGNWYCILWWSIAIYNRTLDEHGKHVCFVIQTLQARQFYVKISICDFFQEVNCLCRTFDHWMRYTKIDPSQIEKVKLWLTTWIARELHSFLGFVGFLWKSIGNYSQLMALFMNLLIG